MLRVSDTCKRQGQTWRVTGDAAKIVTELTDELKSATPHKGYLRPNERPARRQPFARHQNRRRRPQPLGGCRPQPPSRRLKNENEFFRGRALVAGGVRWRRTARRAPMEARGGVASAREGTLATSRRSWTRGGVLSLWLSKVKRLSFRHSFSIAKMASQRRSSDHSR
jgi:hypothetical protein